MLAHCCINSLVQNTCTTKLSLGEGRGGFVLCGSGLDLVSQGLVGFRSTIFSSSFVGKKRSPNRFHCRVLVLCCFPTQTSSFQAPPEPVAHPAMPANQPLLQHRPDTRSSTATAPSQATTATTAPFRATAATAAGIAAFPAISHQTVAAPSLSPEQLQIQKLVRWCVC